MKQYQDLLKHILAVGKQRENRTGIDTISTFGYQNRYDISEFFPLLTTKRVFYKSVFHELIWFIKGDTNIRYLVTNKVNIWNGNAFDNYKKSTNYKGETREEWLAKIIADEQYAKVAGELGPVYGRQWRNFMGVDQLQNVIDQIKKNPTSRRLIVSAWNPTEVDKMALPPCHSLFQFSCDNGELSCQLYQRSADAFLGVPFNIASYALLTYIIAAMTGNKPKEFIHTFGDLHIYMNHLDQVNLQLSRIPGKLPKLIIKRIPENITDFSIDDFEIIDYEPQAAIKGEMAV